MADNVAITAGSGTTIAADDIGGVLYQRVKISQGADGAGTDVSSTAPLQVSLANHAANATAVKVDGSAVTQPVSGTVTITPSGTQTVSGTVAVSTINSVAPAFGTGVRGATVQRVTLATDDVVGITANSSVNVAQMNGIATSMGAGANGTGVQRVTLATDQTAVSTAGVFSVKVDQTTPGTTNAVSLAQIGGTTIVNGGVAGSQSVGGTVATNVAITANPLNLGAQAVSAENTAVTTARQVQLVADLVGKLIVLPYANPENFVSGAITTAMTATTSTSLVSAPGAGLRNYITQITVSNAHATVGTDVAIQDGNAGTTIYTIPAAAVYGGAVVTFPTPLRQPTANTALYCANVTTGASTKVSASGYKGA
jgi:hypothetical protein